MSNSSGASGASKNVPRIVPWLSSEDWRQTRKCLYSNDVEEIRLGLLQAKIWMDRGKVPTAVESTVNFLETILIDREYLEEFLSNRRKNKKANDEEEGEESVSCDNEESTTSTDGSKLCFDERHLRLAYNATVIRFVNELVDRAQKSLFATSITKLADQIGLPRVFVDIRHDGTHDKLNSLELLRWAAGEALKWLEDQYWNYEDEMTSTTWMSEFLENVHGLLDQFCDQLEKINEIQSAVSLEKSSYARIVSQIDFLQTLPRIMKCFLFSLCDYQRCKSDKSVNVIESIIKPLTRNNWEIFHLVVSDVLIERKEICEKWIQWIVEELKKQKDSKKANDLAVVLLEKFAKKSSEELFKDRISKIWEHFGQIVTDDKAKSIFSVFEAVYMKKSKSIETKNKIGESREILKKRRYVEDENLDGWTVVNKNWRPCPIGTIPK